MVDIEYVHIFFSKIIFSKTNKYIQFLNIHLNI